MPSFLVVILIDFTSTFVGVLPEATLSPCATTAGAGFSVNNSLMTIITHAALQNQNQPEPNELPFSLVTRRHVSSPESDSRLASRRQSTDISRGWKKTKTTTTTTPDICGARFRVSRAKAEVPLWQMSLMHFLFFLISSESQMF